MRTRSYLHRRANGRWVVVTPLPDGRKKWQTVGRKKDAERLRDEINRRTVLGAAYPVDSETFSEFTTAWLERYEPRVRPATLALTRNALKHLETFNTHPLELIRAADVEDHVIDEAVLRLKPPRRERVEMRFLTWAEVETLADETVDPYDNLTRFATLSGLRQGELFALRDRAVDFDRGFVLVEAGARNGELVPTKTGAGRRRVNVSGEAIQVLRRQLLARDPNELGLVFPSPAGKIWRKDNFMARIFRPAVRRAELEPLRFHDLRHSYAALMIAAGAHPKLLQSQLGHTSITVTLDRYGHLYDDAFVDVGEALDRLVRNLGVAQG